jgi:hypothetical protein
MNCIHAAMTVESNHNMHRIARVGFAAKGFLYIMMGVLAFMAAFEIGGHREDEATRTGVFESMKQIAGGWLLGAVILGLVCYCIWRLVQTFSRNEETRTLKRFRYFFSALAYGSVAVGAAKLLFQSAGKKDQNQHIAAQLLQHSAGEWLLFAMALVFAGNGLYQLHYALSKKYKNHVQGLNQNSDSATLLLNMGKVGYIARGIVWLLLAFLLGRAAIYQKASEAGDTGKAFRVVEHEDFGSYLLAIIAVGVMAYGVFNFVRARFERF